MAETVKGLKNLLKRLNIPPEDIDKIVQANASEMAQTARRLAPIDKGTLRQSIRKRKIAEFQAKVTAGVPYAAYQEFGTGGLVDVPPELQEIALQFKGKGIKRIDMRPQPFMWPALKLQEPIFEDDIRKYLQKRFK